MGLLYLYESIYVRHAEDLSKANRCIAFSIPNFMISVFFSPSYIDGVNVRVKYVDRKGCWRSVGRRNTHAPIVQQVSDSPPLLSGVMGVFVCLFGRWLTFRRLMSYIYGAPILDVSRSHTTTQHSR